jgi:hypothetical protein
VDEAVENGVPEYVVYHDVENAVYTVETVTLIGTSVVDTTVELAGQLTTPGEHEVMVVMSVL